MSNRYLLIWNIALTALVLFLLVISFINRNEIDNVRIDVFFNEKAISENTKSINELLKD